MEKDRKRNKRKKYCNCKEHQPKYKNKKYTKWKVKVTNKIKRKQRCGKKKKGPKEEKRKEIMRSKMQKENRKKKKKENVTKKRPEKKKKFETSLMLLTKYLYFRLIALAEYLSRPLLNFTNSTQGVNFKKLGCFVNDEVLKNM